MSPAALAIRLGLSRGWIDFCNSMTTLRDVGLGPVLGGIFLAILVMSQGEMVPGTSLSVAALAMPGVLGLLIFAGGMLATAHALAAEREDGTLLRAKALPHGMVGYLTARIVSVSLDTVLGMLIILVPGLFLFDGLATGGVARWLTVLWVLLLGLAATLPWGAILGAVLKTPRAVSSLGFIPMFGFIAISGIFAPLRDLWDWVQWVAQVFPVYWLGLGMRSAFLPDAATAVEIGQSWRTLETIGVLSVWAIAGLLLAPAVLRRMARRESGANLEARRHRALQRIG